MSVEVVSIGNELLSGEVVDTNATAVGDALVRVGLRVHRRQTVPDELDAIAGALQLAASRSTMVVVSGGLGPTTDDCTAVAAARFLGVELVRHEPSLERIHARFQARGLRFTDNNAKQADLPAGAVVLENSVGTAPGFAARAGECRLFFLPGVHREFVRMLHERVLPELTAGEALAFRSRTVRTFGLPESHVGARLDDLRLLPGEHIQYRATFPEILVTPVVSGTDPARVEARLAELLASIEERLGEVIYGYDGDSFPAVVGRALRSAGLTLAVAESCTGGLIGHMLTEVAGSSEYFRLGLVTYSNEAKMALLGVQEATLAEHGAVSEATVREMVTGIRRVSGCDVGLAVSGIAGPSGGTADKPVGTVHIAMAALDQPIQHVARRMPGDRSWVKTIAAWSALDMVRRACRARLDNAS